MNIKKLLILGTLLALTAGIGTAGTVGYTISQGPQTTDFTYSLLLPKFNAALGTLTSVKIYLLGTETITTLTLSNNSASTATFSFTASSAIGSSTNSANAADIFANENLQQLATGSITLGATGGACAFGTPSSACKSVSYASSGTPLSVTNNTGAYGTVGTGVQGTKGVVISGTNIANYIGIGNFTLTGATLAGTSFSGGGGNIGLVQATTASFTAEVDYTYTAASTPEPATYLLTGSMLAGFGCLRLRRRKK